LWLKLFKICHHAGDVSPAVELALEWIPKIPSADSVFHVIGRVLHVNGRHDAAIAIYEQILSCDPNARQTHSELLVHKQLAGFDEDDALEEFDRWNEQFVRLILASTEPATTSRDRERPLRIGFVSNDFGGDHSLNTAMAPWFLHKEKRRNSYFFYSNHPDRGSIHRLFLDTSDTLVDIHGLSDAELDQKIRDDRIDILVDMIGHSDHNRLLTYARKPAPIIVSWIGVGIPTGIEAVDYFLADSIRVPTASAAAYREKVVYLPGTAMAWCPPRATPPIGDLPLLRNQRITFGNLSRFVKIQRETVALWARVLDRVPGSVFLLKDHRLVGANLQHILALFGEVGIGPERLICQSGSGQHEHMASYNEIDIVLDCFPQQGGISSLEAIWMGVPVVSYCYSIKPAGRVGKFIAETIGLSGLSADTQDSYVETAVFLAGQTDKLLALRAGLRSRLLRSAICDIAAFQSHVESAFQTMWMRYCDNLPAKSFAVVGSKGPTRS